MESLKDRWFQADNTPADQLLNEQEFLSFLHPEHSRGMLKYMVKEIVRDLGTSLLTQHMNPSRLVLLKPILKEQDRQMCWQTSAYLHIQ